MWDATQVPNTKIPPKGEVGKIIDSKSAQEKGGYVSSQEAMCMMVTLMYLSDKFASFLYGNSAFGGMICIMYIDLYKYKHTHAISTVAPRLLQ